MHTWEREGTAQFPGLCSGEGREGECVGSGHVWAVEWEGRVCTWEREGESAGPRCVWAAERKVRVCTWEGGRESAGSGCVQAVKREGREGESVGSRHAWVVEREGRVHKRGRGRAQAPGMCRQWRGRGGHTHGGGESTGPGHVWATERKGRVHTWEGGGRAQAPGMCGQWRGREGVHMGERGRGKHIHRSRGEGEHRPEEGRAQAAGEHTGGAGPRESTGLRERAGVSKSAGPREHKHRQWGGRGRAWSGREGVEARVLERTCGGGGVGWAQENKRQASLAMQCPATTSHCEVAAGHRIIRREQEEQAEGDDRRVKPAVLKHPASSTQQPTYHIHLAESQLSQSLV